VLCITYQCRDAVNGMMKAIVDQKHRFCVKYARNDDGQRKNKGL